MDVCGPGPNRGRDTSVVSSVLASPSLESPSARPMAAIGRLTDAELVDHGDVEPVCRVRNRHARSALILLRSNEVVLDVELAPGPPLGRPRSASVAYSRSKVLCERLVHELSVDLDPRQVLSFAVLLALALSELMPAGVVLIPARRRWGRRLALGPVPRRGCRRWSG